MLVRRKLEVNTNKSQQREARRKRSKQPRKFPLLLRNFRGMEHFVSKVERRRERTKETAVEQSKKGSEGASPEKRGGFLFSGLRKSSSGLAVVADRISKVSPLFGQERRGGEAWALGKLTEGGGGDQEFRTFFLPPLPPLQFIRTFFVFSRGGLTEWSFFSLSARKAKRGKGTGNAFLPLLLFNRRKCRVA